MAIGSGTFTFLGGALSDLFASAGHKAKAQGDRLEAGNYDLAANLANQNADFTNMSTAIKQPSSEQFGAGGDSPGGFERQLPSIWRLSPCASCAKPWPENSGNGLMKAKIAGLVVVSAWLVGAAAWAQQAHVPRYREEEKEKSETEKATARDAENAYKRSLGNIPEQKSADPWGTMRSDSAAAKTTDKTASDKAATKAAHVKPKPKTDIKTAPKTDTATKQ